MTSKTRPKVYQLLLDVENLEPVDDILRINTRFQQVSENLNKRRKTSDDPYIEVFLHMGSTFDEISHKLFIQFDTSGDGVNR